MELAMPSLSGTSTPRTRTSRRRAVAGAVAALLAIFVPAPAASAAPPGNDEVRRARVIAAIPSRFPVDTTNATRNEATDVGCVGEHSVWYRFTPKTTVVGRGITLGSQFDTILAVFAGTPAPSRQVACSDDVSDGVWSAVQVRFVAGRTYYIALSSCCVGGDAEGQEAVGGKATLRLYLPRPLAISAPLRRARAGDVSGRALFGGTVRCSNPATFSVGISVSQRVGSGVARGTAEIGGSCGRTRHAWQLSVDSDTAVAFRPGGAVITVDRFVSDGISAKATSHTFVIQLRADPNAGPAPVSPGTTGRGT